MAVPAPLAAAGLRVVLGPAGSIGRVPTGPRLGYMPPPWGWLEGLQGADRSMAASGGAERLQLPWELRFLLMLTPGPSQLLPEAPCSLLFRSHEMPFAFFRAPRSSWHGPAVTQRCPSPRGASQGRSDTALPNPCSRQNNNKKAREPAEKTSHPYLCSSAGAAAGSPARRAPHCQLSTGVFCSLHARGEAQGAARLAGGLAATRCSCHGTLIAVLIPINRLINLATALTHSKPLPGSALCFPSHRHRLLLLLLPLGTPSGVLGLPSPGVQGPEGSAVALICLTRLKIPPGKHSWSLDLLRKAWKHL